jgi:hypothetical protein
MSISVPSGYLWCNSSGLCVLLDDPALGKWFIATFGDNAKDVREDIKQVAKKIQAIRDSPEYRVLRVDDKDKFGRLSPLRGLLRGWRFPRIAIRGPALRFRPLNDPVSKMHRFLRARDGGIRCIQ